MGACEVEDHVLNSVIFIRIYKENGLAVGDACAYPACLQTWSVLNCGTGDVHGGWACVLGLGSLAKGLATYVWP